MASFSSTAAAASEAYETLAKQKRDKAANDKKGSDNAAEEINKKMLEKLKIGTEADQTSDQAAKPKSPVKEDEKEKEVEELEEWLDDFLDED